jgi:UDP-glucose 4-epimerase
VGIRIIDLAERVKEMTRSRSKLEFVPYEKVYYAQGIEDRRHRVPSIERSTRPSAASRS